eukprot:575109-Lingulodinium_polyedra.AAC.1
MAAPGCPTMYETTRGPNSANITAYATRQACARGACAAPAVGLVGETIGPNGATAWLQHDRVGELLRRLPTADTG